MKIVNIGGAINSGKSTVAGILTEKLKNAVFIEVDDLLSDEEAALFPDFPARIGENDVIEPPFPEMAAEFGIKPPQALFYPRRKMSCQPRRERTDRLGNKTHPGNVRAGIQPLCPLRPDYRQ